MRGIPKQLIAFGAVLIKLAVRADALVGFTNDFAILEFDSSACISRLADRKSGRDLLAGSIAATAVRTMENVTLDAEAMTVRGGRLVFTFPGCDGEAVLSVRTERWGFAFKVEKFDLKGGDAIRDFISMRLRPSEDFSDGYGSTLSGCSDARHAIVLRSYDLETAMRMSPGHSIWTIVEDRRPAAGQRMALVAAPRDRVIPCLKAMTVDSGCFYTKCGGAWSLEAPENRRSYLFAAFESTTVDDWIALAERGGFSMVHATGWWKALGHYDPNPARFPGGREELKRCIARIREAGLAVSTHTLTSGIAFNDPWITPACNPEVLALYTYTLAEPLEANATELVVKELPGRRHDLVTTYFSNGNILRIGSELMTYSDLTREPPYTFSGLKRGAYGTRRLGAVPAGTKVDYVFQHFGTLFPDMQKPFGEEMGRLLCRICNDYGFAMVYQDGAEPFLRYQTDLNRLNFSKHLDQSKGPVQIEASTWNTHSWWYHSTCGAADHPVWAPKRFHDSHLKSVVDSVRNRNFFSGQMGWWAPRGPCDYAEGHYTDDMEYFAAKNAANDLAMSVQGVNAGFAVPFNQEAMMTILGWYERARLARAFTPEALAIMRRDRLETCLRPDDRGDWTLAPVVSHRHRIASPDFASWEFKSPRGAATLRVKALYGALPYLTEGNANLVGPGDVDAFRLTAADGVEQSVTVGEDDGHGRTIRIVAKNARFTREGSWTQASLEYEHPFRDASVRCKEGGCAFGFWVKGDGSGTVLNLQLRTPKIYVGGWSDHIVKVDFKGWRYVQLFVRERDADCYDDYKWPYPRQIYSIYRQKLDLRRLEQVNLFLNNLPADGKAEIEISQVRVLPTAAFQLEGASVTVNDAPCAVPFTLVSGEWAELEDGVWTHYSERGDPVERKAGADAVRMEKGVNRCAFASSGSVARAEVQFFVRGKAVKAFTGKVRTASETAYEAMPPQIYDPSKGFTGLKPIIARPGEKARLEFEILGPVRNPSFAFSKASVFTFAVNVGEKEKLVCRNGQDWQVENAKHEVLKKGRLRAALPTVGDRPVTFSADPKSSARVNIVKRYLR